MAKNKANWKKAAGTMNVVGIKLKTTNETLKCFVLARRNGLTLVQLFDFDARFSGYSVIADECIEHAEFYGEESLLDIYARLRRFKPRQLEGIALDSFAETLETFNEKFPLVTLIRRRKSRVERLTGRVIGKTKSKFSFKIIDEEGFWRDKTKEFSFKEILQIIAAGGFENALTLINEQRQPKKRIVLHEI